MKTNWSDYEMYLKPIHLKGKAVTLTIVKTTEEDTHPQGGKSVVAPVLWFRELPFGLILSPINRQTLWTLYGDPVTECIGKPITVQAVAVKVGKIDKTPIRISRMRPNAPQIEPATGESVAPAPSVPAETSRRDGAPGATSPDEPPLSPKGESELNAVFGPNPRAEVAPRATSAEQWPITESEYNEWSKNHGWNGKQTHDGLGIDAKSWLRKHPTLTWADVARQVATHQAAAQPAKGQ